MDRQTKINEFITALEELSSGIVSKSIEVSSPYLDNLEESIINYIDTNYPSIMFSKDELKAAAAAQQRRLRPHYSHGLQRYAKAVPKFRQTGGSDCHRHGYRRRRLPRDPVCQGNARYGRRYFQ